MTATLTAPLDTLTTIALPTAVVRLGDGHREVTVTVPCEPVNPHLAITPGVYLSTDGPRLSNGHNITHLPTGRRLRGGACLACCRTAGKQLDNLDIDWDTTATGDEFRARLTSAQEGALDVVMILLGRCGLESCDELDAY